MKMRRLKARYYATPAECRPSRPRNFVLKLKARRKRLVKKMLNRLTEMWDEGRGLE